MAKKTQPVEENEEIVVSNVLITVENVDVEIEKAKAEITQLTPHDYIEKIKTQYMGMKLDKIEDMTAYTTVVDGIATLKKLCTSIEKRRKAITDPAFKFQRDVKSAADELISQIVPVTKHLEAEKVRFDDAVKAKQNKIFIERCSTLDACGYQLTNGFYVCGVIQIHSDNLRTITDEQFQFYVTEGNKEIERRKAEEERKAQEQKALEETRKALEAERELMAKERAEMAKLRAELEAQKQAMEKQYEKVEEPTTEKVEEPTPEQLTHNAVGSMMHAMGTASTALKEQIAQPEPVAPVAEPHVVHTSASNNGPAERLLDVMYVNGFNDFRDRVIAVASNKDEKLTREILINWCIEQRP